MRSIFKFIILTVFCSLFLFQMDVSAQSGRPGKPDSPDKTNKVDKPVMPVTPKKFDGEFPDVDGWEKDEIYTYPTSALGYSINYESEEGGRVTIYVYNGGMKNISDDANDSTIKGEIARAKSDIITLGKQGYYDNVKEIKSGTQTLGGASGKVKVQYVLLSYKAKGQNLTSEIYLFGYDNNFIKIRATRPKEEVGAENKALADLLSAIDTLFSK